MKCSKVIRVRGSQTPVPCGQCMLCRINRRRVWTTRLLLEVMAYENRASFLTLTYANDHVPRLPSGSFTLYPPHLTLAVKRLRRRYPELRLRYYVVGEYGDESWRPHYHAVLFGLEPSMLRGTVISGRNYSFPWWPHGHVNVGFHCGREAIEYVAQYVTKKLTSSKDERLLEGQCPEFARMSRMGGGGIGAQSLPGLVGISRKYGFVPRSINVGRKELPIGRYLQDKLSLLSGVPKITPAQEVLYRGKMRNLSFYAESIGTSAEQLLSEAGQASEKKLRARPTQNKRSL